MTVASGFQQTLGQNLTTLLDQYEAGRYTSVVDRLGSLSEEDHRRTSLNAEGEGPVLDALRKVAPTWTSARGAEAAPHRRLVIAAFALDLASAHRSFPLNYRRALIVWACGQVHQGVPPSEALRRWYVASMALLESDGDWLLVGGGTDNALADQGFVPELRVGHLAHALDQFPHDASLRLAHAEYAEHETTNHLGASWAGPDDEEIPPALLTSVKDLAAQASGSVPSKQPWNRADAVMFATTAKGVVSNVNRIDTVRAEYEALRTEGAVAADVELHLGYLDERLERWADAILHLRSARLATDPFLRGVGALLEGWAHQRLGETPAAIDAYRQALAMAPHARSASILLGATLSETGDQVAAYDVLDGLWQHTTETSHPFDPWPQYDRGQGRQTASDLEALRAALR